MLWRYIATRVNKQNRKYKRSQPSHRCNKNVSEFGRNARKKTKKKKTKQKGERRQREFSISHLRAKEKFNAGRVNTFSCNHQLISVSSNKTITKTGTRFLFIILFSVYFYFYFYLSEIRLCITSTSPVCLFDVCQIV